MVLLAVLSLGLTACRRETPPETWNETTESTESVETVPETTVPETTEVVRQDVTAREVTGALYRSLGDGSLTIESSQPFSALCLGGALSPGLTGSAGKGDSWPGEARDFCTIISICPRRSQR